jgi:methyltransferase
VIVPLVVLILAFLPMAFEARRASRHDRALRQAGAVEPPDDVYRWMQIVYPATFLSMAAEAAIRRVEVDQVFAAGIVVFLLGKAMKYWAIATLGPRWTFRVLVPPSSMLVTDGPYRYIRHPNYVGVVGEIAGLALVARAAISGPLSIVSFAVLIALRIRVEERTLDQASSH